jgi:peroxiredoxin
MEEKKFNLPAAIIVTLAVVIALVVVSLLWDDSSLESLKMTSTPESYPAPDFRFPDLDGKIIRLSDYRGKVVLVNVWATWCAPCVYEMPSMEKLYKEFKGQNFEILAVSIDAVGDEAVAPFMKKYKLTFPVLLDPEGSIKTLYGVTGIPETFIIDGAGMVMGKIIGPRDWAAPEVFRFFRKLIQQSRSAKG